MSEERLIDLETRIAFQEHTLQELNQVITRQQLQIERLSRHLDRIEAQLREVMPSLVAKSDEETPPPHY